VEGSLDVPSDCSFHVAVSPVKQVAANVLFTCLMFLMIL